MKEVEKVERNHTNDRKGVQKLLWRLSSMHLFADVSSDQFPI